MNLRAEKYKRILWLGSLGFNVPRIYYIDCLGFDKCQQELELWLAKFGEKFANIRTYKYDGVCETWLSKHYTYVPLSDVFTTISRINHEYICMVDLEKPDDGILSGNIGVTTSGLCVTEFIFKPDGGAMVREANKHVQCHIFDKHVNLYNTDLPTVNLAKIAAILRGVRERVSMVPYLFQYPFIVEYSWFKNPCGILKDNYIFWEIRSY